MSTDSDFVDYTVELLAPLGPVYARRMFGAHGVFIDGLMFAIIDGQTLYLKSDPATRAEFEARGLGPFRYRRGGREVSLSYFEAPAEALDDAEALQPWAARAYQAALRGKGRKR